MVLSGRRANSFTFVIAGFIPAIHGSASEIVDEWIPVTSTGMTIYGVERPPP